MRSGRWNNVRAQVSLLAIIGVLIVLAAIGTIYAFRMNPVKQASGFNDLSLAFSNCLHDQMNALIPVAAAHGGELAYAYAPAGTDRTVTTSAGAVVPVWASYTSTCFQSQDCLRYDRPKLDSQDQAGSTIGGTLSGTSGGLTVERQFELALDDPNTVSRCLIDRAKALNATAQVTSVATQVTLRDPIRVVGTVRGSFSRDSKSTAELKGSTELRSSFTELFSAAKNLTLLDSSSGFFANYVNDIVTLRSGLAPQDPYPPIFAYDFSFGTRVWTAQGVASALDQDLRTYLPLVQFASSKTDYARTPYLVRRGVLDLNRSKGDPLGDHVFLSVEPAGAPQVSLNGGQLAQGQRVTSAIPIVGNLVPISLYKTSYDIETPLIVTLRSRDDGLGFSFGLEPRIFHNKPLRANAHAFQLSGSPKGAALAKASEAFCSKPTGTQVSLAITGPDAPDSSNVSLTYRCGAATCTYPFSQQLTLPTCIGGTLSASAPNVRFDDIKLDSKPGLTGGATLKAHARRSVTVSGRLITTTPEFKIDQQKGPVPRGLAPGAERALGSDERMIVQFTGVGNDYTTAAIVNATDAHPTVPLYDGTYLVSVTVIRSLSSPVVIPKHTQCGFLCLIGNAEIPKVQFNDSLVLDQQKNLGPVTISSNAHVAVTVPIFDLSRITPIDQRRIEDLQFYNFADQAMRDANGGIEVTRS